MNHHDVLARAYTYTRAKKEILYARFINIFVGLGFMRAIKADFLTKTSGARFYLGYLLLFSAFGTRIILLSADPTNIVNEMHIYIFRGNLCCFLDDEKTLCGSDNFYVILSK